MSKISGFSKLTKEEKVNWVTDHYLSNYPKAKKVIQQYWNSDEMLQRLHDEFTENTISNYYLPLGIAPNFDIDGELYALPMAIEESSVIAAASKAAKFWQDKGGFKTEVLGTTKVGHVHFDFKGNAEELKHFFTQIKPLFFSSTASITKNMVRRGGGIKDIQLIDKTQELDNYFQLYCTFETKDAMGANFINSCLEQFGQTLEAEALTHQAFKTENTFPEVIMCILSNYVPECLVRAEVSCPISDLGETQEEANRFVKKFSQAIKIAKIEPYRAVTHNKGIMNGVDALVLATGNDFRAVEAGVHAYAAREGSYSSLTHVEAKDGVFKFWIEIPLALGTIGGLTSLHPLVKLSLAMLGNPTAEKLMRITAVAGLAQNFAAVNSLVTTGIQKGHMKMHLMNILNQFEANKGEREEAVEYFKTHTVTHSEVISLLERLRA
ncbi:hydroxymethylglutaryl-CoA reductase, degradative [Psychroflexus gondwanensis]|jgi:hydroxymethylglutaryl-CoA reductase|uniref:hydroxymethylglutaryl-CoA reductase, degradative n=1 Tax=Psychroflexus gondwanensis TaxID=251 RepID=UPI0011BDBB63|nr:hydroxymethylglutaryl-CoA reductase, degradative [Psychroflexus gondwanensis]TXE18430.1 hydroxymethylglutaryl-CoA reductase, degradative [Psychroflexus gondwanensis]